MRYRLLFLCLLALPFAVTAQSLLDSIKDGAANTTRAVGEAAGSAAGAVGGAVNKAATSATDTVSGTTEALRDEATPAETRAKLDEMAEQTLQRLFADQPDTRALFDESVGYAVFDARQASFYVAAGYGRGVAVDRETGTHTYMKMATGGASLGLGIGGFERQLVILFQDQAGFEEFTRNGYDASGGITTMAGERRDDLKVKFTDGRAVFMLTKQGWKVSASVTGSRYWPDQGLNIAE
jgi:lipid-binding SYLF domain-containing protein